MATSWRLARRAAADVDAILSASLERWSELGRSRYATLLYASFEEIAARPQGPLTRARDELVAGLRSIHHARIRRRVAVKGPVHVVYYRRSATGIEIVRVLHERVEPALHLSK